MEIEVANVYAQMEHMKMKMVYVRCVLTNVLHVHLKMFVQVVLVLEKIILIHLMFTNVNAQMVIMKTKIL